MLEIENTKVSPVLYKIITQLQKRVTYFTHYGLI